MGKYWSFLINYLRDQRAYVCLLAVCLLSTAGLQLLKPQIVKHFIDAVGAQRSAQVLLMAALLFMAVTLIEQIVHVGSVYLAEIVGWTATNKLRFDLARHVLQLDLSFHTSHTPGELIERIDGDVTALANFFSRFVIQTLGNALLLIGILLLFFREHWLVGTGMMTLAAGGLLATYALRIRSMPYWIASRQASADLAGFFEERLAGLDDIRANGATAYKMRMLYHLMRVLYRRYLAARAVASLMSNSVFLLQTCALIVGLGLGFTLFYRGAITLGSVFVISYYARMLSWPLRQLVDQIEDLQQAAAGIQRVQELLDTPSVIQDGTRPPPGAGPLAVEFRNVSFAYFEDQPVLAELSFKLEPGRVLGLLGWTGSGKSTLARLLFRFYDPTAGAILLDGVDIRELRLEALRHRVGLVTQEVQLFHGTIRDNLTFFDRSIPDAAVLSAIRELELTEWLASLPHGLDTMLSAGGAGLSAGEAQLLALTRMLLRNPSLVILDEATSRLDLATEQLIERALERLMVDRTGIIITHRLRTVQRVDDILILNQGQAVEFDSREALAANPDSHFARLLNTGLAEVLV